jgi:ABC-type polysaccharide/polyol phosphate export permease
VQTTLDIEPHPAEGWTEVRPATGFLRGLDPAELWAYREVCLTLAARQVRVRYKQTLLGAGWVVIQPLVAVTIFTLVFGRLAGLPSDGLPYAVFALGGLVLWNYVAATVSAATQRLVDDRELITKVYFPRLLAPLAASLAPLIDLAIGLLVLAVLRAVYGVAAGPALLLVPVWVAAAVVVAFAAGTLLSALNVRYRDVGNAIAFLVQSWMFVSPVVFASGAVHGAARVLLGANPVTGFLDGMRWSLGGSPPAAVDLLSVVSTLALLGAAVVYFQRVERRFADVI